MIYFDGEVSCLRTKDTLPMIDSGDLESLVPSPRGYIALINRRSKLVRLEKLSVHDVSIVSLKCKRSYRGERIDCIPVSIMIIYDHGLE